MLANGSVRSNKKSAANSTMLKMRGSFHDIIIARHLWSPYPTTADLYFASF